MAVITILYANTVYQLFLAINMRLHGVIGEKTDLVVSDHTPSLKQYLESLRESGLFRRVFYVESLQIVKGFWKVPEAHKGEAFSNIGKDVEKSEIRFEEYDTLFTANFNPYINAIYYRYPHLNICFYEDGASVCAVDWRKSFRKYSGVSGFMDIFDHVSGVYLNSPELMCVELGWPLLALPKIDKQDPEVRRIYNSIFQYDGSFHFPEFVFVEQSFPVDGVINNDLDFMRIAFEVAGYDHFLVKNHPRNLTNRSYDMGYSRKTNCVLPFELLLLNGRPDETVFITVSSTSLISPWVLFGERSKTILLYKAVSGGINIPAIDMYAAYLDQFVQEYKCRELMVPNSIDEYRRILEKLAQNTLSARRIAQCHSH